MAHEIPGSKSILQRVQAILAYARGEMVIKNFNPCDDVMEMERALITFGFEISDARHRHYRFDESKHLQSKHVYRFEESATAFRLWLSFLASQPGIDSVIELSDNLLRRGFEPLQSALTRLGAEIYLSGNGIYIKGKSIKGGKIEVDGKVSSQYASSLILMAMNTKEGIRLFLPADQVSLPYIELTLGLLQRFGVQHEKQGNHLTIPPARAALPEWFTIDSDLSTAAFYIVLGAIGSDEFRFFLSVDMDLIQPDIALFDLLRKIGGDIKIDYGICKITPKKLSGFDFSIHATPDLMPLISILALFCSSKSTIRGVSRLQHKESNRLLGITRAFDQIGVKYECSDDCLIIHPIKDDVPPAILDTQNDHRLVMAFLALHSRFPQVVPSETQSLSKSCKIVYNLKT